MMPEDVSLYRKAGDENLFRNRVDLSGVLINYRVKHTFVNAFCIICVVERNGHVAGTAYFLVICDKRLSRKKKLIFSETDSESLLRASSAPAQISKLIARPAD